jgi:hypothetical protein
MARLFAAFASAAPEARSRHGRVVHVGRLRHHGPVLSSPVHPASNGSPWSRKVSGGSRFRRSPPPRPAVGLRCPRPRDTNVAFHVVENTDATAARRIPTHSALPGPGHSVSATAFSRPERPLLFPSVPCLTPGARLSPPRWIPRKPGGSPGATCEKVVRAHWSSASS